MGNILVFKGFRRVCNSAYPELYRSHYYVLVPHAV
ncbi:hypothetical protein SAMN05216589_3261 [Halopseudomonas bauzanensis]|uniref:Uncharacterized protein n=1 Tax=Halopseudomonas bauzanensis TaxID=653930 RepID=A0A1H9WHT8_9GAMM|nr:hypothetical protein SAMN05216589_3261 [Halopseudomonas bauzanensis]